MPEAWQLAATLRPTALPFSDAPGQIRNQAIGRCPPSFPVEACTDVTAGVQRLAIQDGVCDVARVAVVAGHHQPVLAV